MELGLFTRGAYIWPVYRNFEAFIASLGAPGHDVARLADCPAYPVRSRTDGAVHGLSPEMDARLVDLHRELYDALLRPVEQYQRRGGTFSGHFLPDLEQTAAADLLDAFMYYFTNQVAGEMPVADGLTVLRGVFFSHEAVEPGLWLHSSRERVSVARCRVTTRAHGFIAPPSARISDLAFCVCTARNRPAGGPGWLTGRAQRELDGHCHIRLEYGLDPSLPREGLPEGVARRLDAEAESALATVFGWECGVAP